MKNFAICVMVLMVAAAFVPTAQAQVTSCYVLTNFCDGIQTTDYTVGGAQAKETAALWDWICLKAGTGSLMSGGPGKFGTQPTYPFVGGTPSGFSANFTFGPKAKGFDLYGTFDGSTINAFQVGQAYKKVKGACNPLAPKTGRSTTGR